jgi:sortase A
MNRGSGRRATPHSRSGTPFLSESSQPGPRIYSELGYHGKIDSCQRIAALQHSELPSTWKTMVRRSVHLERALLIFGISLLAFYAAARLRGDVLSRLALWQFKDDRIAAGDSDGIVGSSSSGAANDGRVDFRLWSSKRISAYREALLAKTDPPLAVLAIPRLGLEVPVFEGTDDLALNRGAGRIQGTGKPGGTGNIGIAAHRDGFFRTLKDIQIGDEVQLVAPALKAVYLVDEVKIVNPEDISVLRSSGWPSLTLVTCYPFYFVGSAPNRFIVHASIKESEQTKTPDSKPPSRNNNKESSP